MSRNSVEFKPSKLEFFVEILTVLGQEQLTIEGLKSRLEIGNNNSLKMLQKALTFLETQNCISLKRHQAVCLYRNTQKGKGVARFFNLFNVTSSESLLVNFEIKKHTLSNT